MTDQMRQPKRGLAAIRWLAAALAGGIGAFGVPAATHSTTTSPAATPNQAAAVPVEIRRD